MSEIGQLRIGDVTAEIEKITFAGDKMRVAASLGPGVVGALRGKAIILGTDGSICWGGRDTHDFGVKTAGAIGTSVWHILFEVDLMTKREEWSAIAKFDPTEGDRA